MLHCAETHSRHGRTKQSPQHCSAAYGAANVFGEPIFKTCLYALEIETYMEKENPDQSEKRNTEIEEPKSDGLKEDTHNEERIRI